MLFIGFLFISVLSYMIYYRYVPVNVKRWKLEDISQHHILVDVRDYQDSSKLSCDRAVTIPCGYLDRYYHEIPEGNIVVLGSTSVECNVGVRQLKKLGINVVGYVNEFQNRPCHETLSMS